MPQFGRSFNLLAAGKDDAGFLPAVTNLSVYGSIAGTLPSLSPLIKKYFYSTTLFPPSIIGKLTWERVQDRLALMSSKEEVAAREDMLAGFMKSKYPGTEIPVEPPEVVALASSVISAGSDTTAIALDAFFYYILTNNAVYDRVQREVDAAYDAGVLRDGEPVRYAQGVKLEYLLACVKESMRLITPFVMDMLRVVPQAGLRAGKWFLPAGTEVGTNSYAFHRNKEAFGEDAENFRPERWIGLSAEERSALERNFMSVSDSLLPSLYVSLSPGY
jgi:cytochrome P450